jgi:hypothetical protein
MPSAGTIFNLKIEIDSYHTGGGIRRWRSGSASGIGA